MYTKGRACGLYFWLILLDIVLWQLLKNEFNMAQLIAGTVGSFIFPTIVYAILRHLFFKQALALWIIFQPQEIKERFYIKNAGETIILFYLSAFSGMCLFGSLYKFFFP